MTFMPSYFILCQTDNKNVIAQGSPFLVWNSFVQLLTFFVLLCESNMKSTGDIMNDGTVYMDEISFELYEKMMLKFLI